jgi:hypothetical protein
MNIGRLHAPVGDPMIADFVAQLDEINALADATPGFVWRLQTEDGNATAVRAYDDELIAINMSVWESIEALGDYVYRSAHTRVLRRRREWFEHTPKETLVMWWIPAGEIPTVQEGVARLEYLRAHGSTAHAFTFRTPFAPDDAAARPDDRNACPA